MLIRKFFWPVFTVLMFLAVMALWFGVGVQEKRLSYELSELSSETNWLSYDVDGFNVTLHGYAPDVSARDNVLAKVKAFKNIGKVESDIILLSEQKDNYLMFIVEEDSITVRGTVPVGMVRFKLINQISAERPGIMVYDELDAGGVMPEKFKQDFSFFLQVLPNMKTGIIAVKNDTITADRITLYKLKDDQNTKKTIKIPSVLKIDDNCVWDKPKGGYWQNPCSQQDKNSN